MFLFGITFCRHSYLANFCDQKPARPHSRVPPPHVLPPGEKRPHADPRVGASLKVGQTRGVGMGPFLPGDNTRCDVFLCLCVTWGEVVPRPSWIWFHLEIKYFKWYQLFLINLIIPNFYSSSVRWSSPIEPAVWTQFLQWYVENPTAELCIDYINPITDWVLWLTFGGASLIPWYSQIFHIRPVAHRGT